MIRRIAQSGSLILLVCFLALLESRAQQAGQLPQGVPQPQEGDYIAHDLHFKSGETLAEVRLHYMTFGKPARDASGREPNANKTSRAPIILRFFNALTMFAVRSGPAMFQKS